MGTSYGITYEIDNLIKTIQTAANYGKQEFESFYQSVQEETACVEKALASLVGELADIKLQLDELLDKERQLKTALLECSADSNVVLSQASKAGYEEVLQTQINLAAVREQEIRLRKKFARLEERLKYLVATRANIEKTSFKMSVLADDFSGKYEIVDKIKVLAQSQNFGFMIIKAQEEERSRVAREIHDGPAQAMANVVFLAEVCEKLIGLDAARAKRELHELREQVRGCLTETRKIIFDLRPMALDDLGLIPTVKRIADMARERTGTNVDLKLSGAPTQVLADHVELGVFRVIQEALNNIEKHSNAADAQIFVEFADDYIAVAIEDNGIGFEVTKNHSHSGSFGLMGMRERVNLLQGELEIDSQRGRGTKISVKIPLLTTNEVKQLA